MRNSFAWVWYHTGDDSKKKEIMGNYIEIVEKLETWA